MGVGDSIPYLRMKINTTSIAANSTPDLTWTVVDSEVLYIESNTKMTAVQNGLYSIYLRLSNITSITPTVDLLVSRDKGTTWVVHTSSLAYNTTSGLTLQTKVKLNSNDQLKFRINNNSATTGTLSNVVETNYCLIQKE